MAPRHVPETRDPTAAGHLDVLGATLAALGLAGTTYALIEAPGAGASPAILIAAIGGVLALVAFVIAERRQANPMMPLAMFANRQFTAANLVTVVVYAALGGVFFLLVAFLQISMGWSPLAAGAASLPVTALMLLFSARSGAFAQRDRPAHPADRRPARDRGGDADDDADRSRRLVRRRRVLPAMIVFGIGLTLVVAPVTATVLAAADARHAGIASGINNAVSRVAGLFAVAVLPLIAGLTGDAFYDPVAMTDGFHMAMVATAALAALGGVVAWLMIDPHVLAPEEEPPHYQCPISGAPLRASHEAREPAEA